MARVARWIAPTVPTRPEKVHVAESDLNSTSKPSTTEKGCIFFRTKTGLVCVKQPKESNQDLSGSHAVRGLELGSGSLSLAQTTKGPATGYGVMVEGQ